MSVVETPSRSNMVPSGITVPEVPDTVIEPCARVPWIWKKLSPAVYHLNSPFSPVLLNPTMLLLAPCQ